MRIESVRFWRTKSDKKVSFNKKEVLDSAERGIMINSDQLIIDKNGNIVKKIFDYTRCPDELTINFLED
jgi:hypothetical protein